MDEGPESLLNEVPVKNGKICYFIVGEVLRWKLLNLYCSILLLHYSQYRIVSILFLVFYATNTIVRVGQIEADRSSDVEKVSKQKLLEEKRRFLQEERLRKQREMEALLAEEEALLKAAEDGLDNEQQPAQGLDLAWYYMCDSSYLCKLVAVDTLSLVDELVLWNITFFAVSLWFVSS